MLVPLSEKEWRSCFVKRMIKLISLSLALLIVIGMLCGCGKNEKNTEEPDGSEIVASIGNEKVTYALYRAAFDSYLEYMTQLGYDPLSNEEELASYQDWILDYILMDIVVLYNAELEGYELSEEQEAEAQKQAEDELKSIYDEYWQLSESEHESDPSKSVQEYFDEYVAALSEYFVGERMNFEQYSARYAEETRKSFIIEGYKELVCADFSVSEEDIIEWYGEQYDSDRECYAESPEMYKTDRENFEMYFGISDDVYPVTYTPEGYSRIMDIVVKPSGKLGEEYETKSARLAELYDECSLLMFNDALNGNDANSERIAELLDEYRALEAECDALYEEFTASAREKIDAAYLELEGGADFADVMLKYTENAFVTGDDEYEGCEAFRTEGQIISLTHSSKDDWSDTVKDIFGMLEVGEYSTVFADDDGSFHIIYHASDIEAGEIGLDAVREAVSGIVKAQQDNDSWNELVKTWMKDPKLEINIDLVRLIGKSEIQGNK